jgi:hypothetical protein
MHHHKIVRISLPIALLGVATFAFLAATVQAQTPAPTVQSLTQTKPQRLLFIGNSYLYYGDSVHNHVRRMVVAAGLHKKKQLKYKSATISGSAIFDHNIDSYLELGKLRVKKPFQVVILQGGSAASWRKGRDARFRETVAEFSKKIAAAGGETALYMTHAYVKPHKRFDPDMMDAVAKLYVTTGNANGSLVIPVGLAFEEAYRRRPDGQFHKPFDGSHPNFLGTYLAASVVFGSLYGESPVGNPYDYFGTLAKEDIAFLQNVAQDTVTKFYDR